MVPSRFFPFRRCIGRWTPRHLLLVGLLVVHCLGNASSALLRAASVTRVEPPEKGFYAKRLDCDGIIIKASTNVADEAFAAACDRLSLMLSNLPTVRAKLRAAGAELHIIGRDEVTTDLPEWRHDKGKPLKEYNGLTRDQRTRGMGGLHTSCGEENLLRLQKDRYRGRDICVHEFAHNILQHGTTPGMRQKVREQYRRSLDRGLWAGSYAGSNFDEFFAELSMWYFGTHGDLTVKGAQPANGRAGLKAYDPEAFELLDAFYSGRMEHAGYSTRVIQGWTLHISKALWEEERSATEAALPLLEKQLTEIARAVPAPALAKLREVPLWFSPAYPGVRPRAEYHPGSAWLREHGRNPEMAKGVEFTDVRDFEKEMNRMPNFTLHELAHAYHDRVLGFDNREIQAAYDRAKEGKTYDKVERWFGNGRTNTFERAYAMTSPQEYFAESTEAFFSRNDFYPFNREELKGHDPEMFALLARVWGVSHP